MRKPASYATSGTDLRLQCPVQTECDDPPQDFDAITENRTLCDADGEMDPHTFEVMMLRQLQSYALRQLANTMLEVSGDKVPHNSLLRSAAL
eukprot:1076112-Rhodomonas_salina.2